MKIIAIVLLCLSALLLIVFLLILIGKYRTKRYAFLGYYYIKSAYEYMLFSRRMYYQAHSIEDDDERQKLEASWKKIYDECIEILSNPINTELKAYLSEEQRNDLEEILSRPRYELI